MKSLFLILSLAALAIASTTPTTTTAPPKSTDAASFLSEAIPTQPAWATGKYETSLASALYPLATSFAGRPDYTTLIDAIWSAASKDGGDDVIASLSASGWLWESLAEDAWYTKNVPTALQTQVVKYDEAWDSAYESVQSVATATGNAAAPRCTGGAVAGMAVGVAAAAVVGIL